MKKLKEDISTLLSEKCSDLVYSSKHGDILIPKTVLDLNLELIQEIVDDSTDLEDVEDIMDFLKQHLDMKTLIDFRFDVGMGSSTNPLYLVDLENDRKYLIYYFGVLGEYWLLGALTNYNKHLLEKFFELSLLRQETKNPSPFQFMYGTPTSYDNYCIELLKNEFLNGIFIQLESNT